VLHESFGMNGEDAWSGQTLTSSGGGSNKSITFSTNLPSSSTAGRRVLIATPGFAALGLVTPNYTIPNGFSATHQRTINYAGVDQVTYASLPTNGNAIDRSGTPIANVATNFAGTSASVPATQTPAPTGRDHHARKGIVVGSDRGWHGIQLRCEAWRPGAVDVHLRSGRALRVVRRRRSARQQRRDDVAHVIARQVPRRPVLSCPYTGRPTLGGSDGTITITFTSPTSATVNCRATA
jgi:hypothetical protein